jgi:hypothetical protein
MQNGAVLINKGKGFVPMGPQSELSPGTQIMVQPGGSASIAYANNCTVRVGSGIWLVQAAPPCSNGATEIDFTGRMNQQTQPADDDPNLGPIVIGAGIAVAVGVTIFATTQSGGSNKPASP